MTTYTKIRIKPNKTRDAICRGDVVALQELEQLRLLLVERNKITNPAIFGKMGGEVHPGKVVVMTELERLDANPKLTYAPKTGQIRLKIPSNVGSSIINKYYDLIDLIKPEEMAHNLTMRGEIKYNSKEDFYYCKLATNCKNKKNRIKMLLKTP